MERTDPAADESLADIRARIRFGMAMAAMIKMMATTISSSISENPFCLCLSVGIRLFFPQALFPATFSGPIALYGFTLQLKDHTGKTSNFSTSPATAPLSKDSSDGIARCKLNRVQGIAK